jgi:threonylcarbamoyladenosine tRNA methylthiotransferase MtaB
MTTDPRPGRAAIVTFGCKVNQHESAALAGELAGAGYETAPPEEADVVVVNTCTVTDKADREALRLIRRLKRRRPGALVVATGCLAQADPGALSGPGLADLVLGQAGKARLVESLALPRGTVAVSGLGAAFGDLGDPVSSRTRAFHKIQDGCDQGCAYCAVPLARGPSRSLNLERVLSGLEAYLARGTKEIVLTGVHLGRWGLDLDPPSDLAGLLEKCGPIIEAHGARLRLSSLEPLEAPLAEPFLRSAPWLAPHLHAPLQSGSGRILAAMSRPYAISEAMAPLLSIKEARPELNLGTDLICGFPGETEADFEATRSLVEGAPFGRLHVFPFSPRRGTTAGTMAGQVPEAVKRARVAALRRLGAAKERAFLLSQIGRPRQALVEAEARPEGPEGPKVLTDNYIRAVLPKDAGAAPGTLVTVFLGLPAAAGGLPTARLAPGTERCGAGS